MSAVGNRYGEALFEAALEESCLDRVHGDARLLEGVFAENPDLGKVLDAPTVSKAEKNRLLDTIFEGQLHELSLNFLHVLSDKGRFGFLQDALRAFEKRYRQEKGIVIAWAVTAVPPSDLLADRLRERLVAATGKQIELVREVDPSVQGGVRITLETGEQLDGTVHRRIGDLRRAMETAIF